jgi:excisionase family DNA binding protein
VAGAGADDLLTAKELAAQLGVKYATVLHWRRLGRIAGHRLPRGGYRFRLAEVRAAVPPERPRDGRFHDSPLAWFGELLLGMDRLDIDAMAEARDNLARLGWTFRYRRPRPAGCGGGERGKAE